MADTAVEDVLRALGASDEDVALAFASGRPASRAADVVLGRDITLTAADVASRLSMSAPEVSRSGDCSASVSSEPTPSPSATPTSP
jgi:hypothetical protein